MKIIRSASLVLTAVLIVLVPGLANADARKHSDSAGDVQYWVNTDPSYIPPPIAAPSRTRGDITAVRVTHGTSTVKVVTYFRSLPRSGQFQGHVFRFVAGTFQRRVQITAGPDEVRRWKGQSEMFTTSDRPVACRGMKHLLDYSHRRVILKVPRACLRNTKSVKVGVATVMLANDRTYFDDAYRTGGTLGTQALTPSLTPTLGPAVAR